uniref:Uncharacterized protein n=1 Tax=Tetranychus urticae TaxID=32264 RepID=T1KND6_TETUR
MAILAFATAMPDETRAIRGRRATMTEEKEMKKGKGKVRRRRDSKGSIDGINAILGNTQFNNKLGHPGYYFPPNKNKILKNKSGESIRLSISP